MDKALCHDELADYIDTVCTDKNTVNTIRKCYQKKSIVYTDNPKDVLVRLQQSKVIYIEPNSFDEWTDILLVLQEKNPLPIRLIIIAGADYAIGDEHMEIMCGYFPNTQFWIQNWVGSLKQCHYLPLGVVFSHQPPLEKKEKYLGISFLLNYIGNEKRESFFKFLENHSEMEKFLLPRSTYEGYCKELSKCYYSPCPMGEGFDTYRFWECLSLKVVPIVKDHVFYDTVHETFPDLPMIRIKEWEDLLGLELQEIEFPDLPYVRFGYWVDKLKSIVYSESD